MSSPTQSCQTKVKVELSAHLLASLITSGVIKGTDCRCLDTQTKQVVWKSLLDSSAQS